jgi:2,3-dimethylmalate lyase
MVMHPTTLLFQITRTVERALSALKAGTPMSANASVYLDAFEDIVGLSSWRAIVERFGAG